MKKEWGFTGNNSLQIFCLYSVPRNLVKVWSIWGIPSIDTVVCVSLRRQFWRCLNSYFPLRNDCLHYFINTPYEKTEYALQKYRSWYIGNHNSGQQKLYQEREFFAKIFRVSRHWALVFCWYLSNYQKLVPWYESLNICFNEPLSLFWL